MRTVNFNVKCKDDILVLEQYMTEYNIGKITFITKSHDFILPDNLTCDVLNMEYTNISTIPKNLTCNVINISCSRIKNIPSCTKVKSIFNARHITDLYIPDNFSTGSLDLKGSNLIKFPDNLEVNGTINICDTNVVEIPMYTYIRGDIVYNSNVINISVTPPHNIRLFIISWKSINGYIINEFDTIKRKTH